MTPIEFITGSPNPAPPEMDVCTIARVDLGEIVWLINAGANTEEVMARHPQLSEADVHAVISYAKGGLA